MFNFQKNTKINDFLHFIYKLELKLIGMDFWETPIQFQKSHIFRLLYFYDLFRKIESIEGDIVECGVGQGTSMLMISLCNIFLDQRRSIYGFDSFKGLPQPSQEDNYKTTKVKRGRHCHSKKSVITYLINSGISHEYIDDNIVFADGYFNDSLIKYRDRKIALLHLDVDLFKSYELCLEHFYPMVSKGGIIMFDEYLDEKYPGAKKAIDKFININKQTIEAGPIGKYYIVK